MPQIYKIYINETVLTLADFEPKNTEVHQSIDYEDLELIDLFKQSKNNVLSPNLLVTNQDSKQLFKRLTSNLKVIKAAGGLVKNGKGELLMIYRLSKWDLPKGKVDEGETMEEASVREVEEECGIKVNYRGKKLATTYHLYQLKKELVIKKTNWYEMGVNNSPKLKPQKEEDITKAIWCDPEDFDQLKSKTYPMIKDLLNLFETAANAKI